MDKIQNAKELKSLLSKQSFTVNYYQREYRWGRKQIEQLVDDLSGSFLEYYNGLDVNKKPYEHIKLQEVSNYGYYYMGSIIRTMGNNNEIIDGQQRLTSITLLLIYLKNLVKSKNDPDLATQVAGILDDMIYSDHYGEKTFNIDVPERRECFTNLFNNVIDFIPQDESSDTMKMRYLDIVDVFPDELKGNALIYFIYWLVNKVLFMEIITPTEQDAHKIFVTMNDRGLSLNSAEMLKGYLLSEIVDNDNRNNANKIWKEKMAEIKDSSKVESDGIVNTEDVDFIATWIRAKYATSMRDTKKGAEDQDYEIIGREFHQWIRTNHNKINLKNSNDFYYFVVKEMPLYADIYLRLKEYSNNFDKDYEYVFYNNNRDLTYQTMLIFASINKEDNSDTIDKKIKLISCFIDQFASIRSFNFKKSNYNSNKDILFKVMNNIRTLSLIDLAKYLIKVIKNMNVTLDGIDRFELNQFTGRYMLHILARFTSFIDEKIGNPNKFAEYVNRKIKNPYDIEHIIPDDYDSYSDIFTSEDDLHQWRAKLGNLILLTKDKNRSYQDKFVSEKIKLYLGDNCLAKALNSEAYKNNPGFLKLNYGFKSYEVFNKDAIQDRQTIYKNIAKDIWNTDNLKAIVGGWEENDQDKTLDSFDGRNFVIEYNGRSWKDAIRFGFISAGAKRLDDLRIGDRLFCHKANVGYLGVGIVSNIATSINDTIIEDKPFISLELENKEIFNRKDEQIVLVDWIKFVNEEKDAYWEKGLKSLPNTLYQLSDDYTYNKVLEHFNLIER